MRHASEFSKNRFPLVARVLMAVLLTAAVPYLAGAVETKIQDALKASDAHHTDVFAKYGPAVVGIVCTGGDANAFGQYTGTGAVISPDGWIATNITTVPKNATRIKVYFTDGHVRNAVAKGVDETTEGSLIKVDAKDLPYMRVSDSKDYKVGDPVYSWSNAFSAIQKDGSVSLSAGNISGMYLASSADNESRYVGPVIETDAAVNPGSDGGPLTDAEGNLVGVMTLAYSRTRWLGLAIPTATLAEKLPDFKALMKSRRTALTSFKQSPISITQAAFESAAERVSKAVITLRIVRENDSNKDVPLDFRKVEVKAEPPISTDRGELEAKRPVNGYATAFIISEDGVALTAYFNVDEVEEDTSLHRARMSLPAPQLRRQSPPKINKIEKIYAYLADGKRVEAKLLGIHKVNDVAAIKLELPKDMKVPFIEMKDSCELSTGSSVAVLGRSEPPGGMTLNTGRVSGQCRQRNTCCQVNALINYGNIGGPAIGLDGKLLGMAAQLNSVTDWRQNCGVGFLLLTCEIKKSLPSLLEGKTIDGIQHGFMGVTMDEKHFESEVGAYIGEVLTGSAADKGGVKSGDIVIEYNGKKVRNWVMLTKITRSLDPGAIANLKVKRGTQTVDLKVVLGEPMK
ncbi:MAG: trypsin-like peptidase domain-containing protein [Planctomycetota bacterium]